MSDEKDFPEKLSKKNANSTDVVERRSHEIVESNHNSHPVRSSHAPLPIPTPGDVSHPTIPDAPAPVKWRDRSRVVKGTVVIGQSLSNTADDHLFRSLRPSSAANSIFLDRYLKSTYNDYMRMLEPTEEIERHRHIDERQLPFRELLCNVEGVSLEGIEANQTFLQWTLGVATAGVLYSVFKTMLFTFTLFLMQGDASVPQIISVFLWVGFLFFSVTMYLFYGYHNWVLERDRFGTFSMFMSDYLLLKREAIFPYKFARKWFD